MSAKTAVFSLDEATIGLIEEKFAFKRRLAAAREKELFGIFDEDLSDEESMALKYLYAYMPLHDLADYDGALFLSHVRATLDIRKKVPWGGNVPDPLFLHYVLPYRVNNENIEDSRRQLFEELYPRVKGLSMTEAVLETNHWCHEKATYAGNDRRTVSPLTLIRTALGRCGEQSALAVAALRSLCIPARQCYTPLWAHCDSNHAWVEAWTDGGWHFLGACEPEPRLDMGWFRQPARRAMLVHTRVAADYPGPEPLALSRPWYAILNLTTNYAAVNTVTVRVKNPDGRPAQAKVEFQLYNYAEFAAIAHAHTDERGEASIRLGLGDVLVYASGEEGAGFVKIRVGETSEAEIVLSKRPEERDIYEFDMVPPPDLPDPQQDAVTENEKRENERRIKQGAQIRAEYEATFLHEKEAERLAAELNLPAARVWEVLKHARGNSHEIAAFLREQTPVHGEWPLRLLESLNVKDNTDTFRPTLEDHLYGSLPYRSDFEDEIFTRYILCPRIDFEMIVPYKAFFREQLSGEDTERFRRSPAMLAEWINSWFEVLEDYSHYKGMATPVGSYRLKKGDRLSRDILFAAVARSIGIPARLEPTDKRPQYWQENRWIDVSFPSGKDAHTIETGEAPKGYIRLVPDAESDEPARYFNNFTLARCTDGVYQTLHYEFGKSDLLDKPLEALPGKYRLTTGTRLPDGTVLVRWTFFELQAGQTVETLVKFRKQTAVVPTLGHVNPNLPLESLDGKVMTLGSLAKERGLVIAWIEPDREPTKHLVREIRELAAEFRQAAAPIVLMVGDDKRTASFTPQHYGDLSGLVTFGRDDAQYAGLRNLSKDLPEAEADLRYPAVFVLDNTCTVRHRSAGYKLGLGREIVKVLRNM